MGKLTVTYTRRLLLQAGGVMISGLCGVMAESTTEDPWPREDLLEPATLAASLRNPGPRPLVVICVAFPVLYRQRHIAGAVFAGPASKAEGLATLRQAFAKLPKGSEVVLYCGCCPMVHCPNIRPAYRAAKEHGIAVVKVLNLPVSFHADWSAKGYPVEPAAS